MRTFRKNRILFFDVETNGLLPSRSDTFMPEKSQLHRYPHILQLSFVVFNLATRSVDVHADYYIRPPPEVIIPSVVTDLTGITREICMEKGILIGDALESFQKSPTAHREEAEA